MKPSKRGDINEAELKRVAKNALIFLAPVAIIILDILQRNGGQEEILVAVKVWVLGVALDFFRKVASGK